jgi:hypothetical protein
MYSARQIAAKNQHGKDSICGGDGSPHEEMLAVFVEDAASYAILRGSCSHPLPSEMHNLTTLFGWLPDLE